MRDILKNPFQSLRDYHSQPHTSAAWPGAAVLSTSALHEPMDSRIIYIYTVSDALDSGRKIAPEYGGRRGMLYEAVDAVACMEWRKGRFFLEGG